MVFQRVQILRQWFVDRKGATAIEYGLIAAGVAVAISIVVFALGDSTFGLFEMIGEEFDERFG